LIPACALNAAINDGGYSRDRSVAGISASIKTLQALIPACALTAAINDACYSKAR
jgi:tellurite resistance protein